MAPVVSVIIPCYNQAHFLGAAIDSVREQTYPHHEIIVVDDGSTDGTAGIAASYPTVRYVRQENQGTAVARNTGLRASTGSHLVFLDADDRLLPQAIAIALDCLDAHPGCAMAFGLCRRIAADGAHLAGPQPPHLAEDNYLGLLRRSPIWHPAAAMFRRLVFDAGIAFNPSRMAVSDYEVYLSVARRWPTCSHDHVISEYRQHRANKSLRTYQLLTNVLAIVRSQWGFVKGNKRYEEAYRTGRRGYQELYCRQAAKQVLGYARTGGGGAEASRDLLVLLRYGPRVLSRLAGRVLRSAMEDGTGSPPDPRTITWKERSR